MSHSSIYRRLAELPIFSSASFISGHRISIESSVRDHVNNVKRSFIQEAGILESPGTSSSSTRSSWLSTPIERSESIVARLISPSGARTAILKETSGTPKKRFVEIWKGDAAELIVETTSRHGPFYGDATFSSLCFSPKEDALLYTAEAKAPEEDPKDPFHKFTFREQYGEQFIDRRSPTLFWLRWDPSRANLRENDEDGKPISQLVQVSPTFPNPPSLLPGSHALNDPPVFSLGQATFASRSGRSVIATAYLRTAGDRKLGIVYCANRPSMIVRLTFPDTPLEAASKEDDKEKKKRIEEATVECRSLFSEFPSRSPRVWFPPTESEITTSKFKNPVAIWISSAKEPHGSCARLHMMTLPSDEELCATGGWESTTNGNQSTSQVETVIDSVWEPPCPVDEGGFPGLYINQLPPSPFLFLDGVLHATCVSSWGCSQDLLVIRLEKDYVEPPLSANANPPASYVHGARKHEVHRLQLRSRSCTSFVACDGRSKIVAVASTLTEPNEVYVTDIHGSNIKGASWTKITNIGDRAKELTDGLEGKVTTITGHEPTQTIYIRLANAELQPLVTFPHGGPHSVTPSTFSPEVVAFALSGYTISCPNYRGSLGYGQRWVEELLGKIGRLDVDDVMASTNQLIEAGLGKKGLGMQLYMGGSHGGFLGAHVIGQFPSFFSAAILRNPVINVPAMYATTDIPDWTTVECGIPYDPNAVLTPQQYETLYKMSPIQYVDKVVTPVLLRIGDVDQRVPPSQGKEYYHLLRARGMGEKVQMLWYPENSHPLDKVEAERSGWDASLAWFKKYGGEQVYNE
ncbi:hypothetical protein M408DRAFT_330224 [Serendipita vermifera MAFF 305830]|uniref:Prolyl endopeptidase n=1 Tax=Serendipita vermifera MAFF 305830 TaxID=933852 RepID=A0A0C2XDI3_SERVB|nr:hypothetical protein M408DRAFT_330224 [Serendipita vermifera MAFF 305830]